MNLLNCLGIGIVASTKQTNSDEVMVYLPSLFPTAEGRGDVDVDVRESVSKAEDGTDSNARVLRSNTIPAKWLRMGDVNRLTPPDVREGSKVAIYQVSGQNQYYWTSFGVTAETMRLETVIYGWSANPNISENVEVDLDNFYVMTVSTHTGQISLRTSQANGEATTFEAKFDTKTGKFVMVGKNQSNLMFDDIGRRLFYCNKDGSVLDINKKNISLSSRDSVNVIADKAFNIKTEIINIHATELNADVPTTNWKGNWNLVGDVVQEGNISQKGNKSQKGSHTSSGIIHSDTDVTSDFSLNKHKHGDVESGKGTTSTPV